MDPQSNYSHSQPTQEDLTQAIQTAERLVGNSNAIPLGKPAPANAEPGVDHPHQHTVRALWKVIILLALISAAVYGIMQGMNYLAPQS